ncbi:MAG: DUF3108 domain-containing protein [Rugosibacter sp.]|nr:DUF3108 domain-containing protein [Rugosibacter sp.]
MPLLIAFVTSAAIHAAALLGPGWALPDWSRDEATSALEAQLVMPRPASHPVTAEAVAPPEHKPLPHPPRHLPRAAAAPPVEAAPEDATPLAGASTASTAPPVAVSPAPTFDPAAVLAAQGRVRYIITRGEGGFVVGQSVHTWQRSGSAYMLESVTETTGIAALFKPARIVQQSRGEITAAGLQPHAVHQEDKKGTRDAVLDWTTRQITAADLSAALPEGTQDMLSMNYQLAWQLAALPPGSAPPAVIALPIITRRAIETYRFEFVDAADMAYNQRSFHTLRYRTKNGADIIELWFAPELRGLPLQIRFIDRKGEIFDQRADSIDLHNEHPENP